MYFFLTLLWLTSVSCYKRPADISAFLLNEFQEVAHPEISYQGDAVLFQAKRNSMDSWQIWEYNFEREELDQLTDADTDCTHPTYLPDGKIVYSRFVGDYSGYNVLETCDADGSSVQQITFAPVDYRSPIVLQDGRILVFAREVHPQLKRTQLLVMRPDGTKIELFYEAPEGSRSIAAEKGLFETSEGRIVFSVADHNKEAETEWISVDYKDPLNSRMALDPKSQSGMNSSVSSTDIASIDWQYIKPRPRPKKLPSAVNPESETALLLCMDANLSESMAQKKSEKSVQIELLGLEGSLGIVDLEQDGSVYLKIQADMPFRMQTLDPDGMVIDGPSSWLQMRPNERRGCVGCHAGHTRVPDNRQPLAVQKEPIEIPLYRESIMASRHIKKEKK